jgi:hypothetical protein
MGPNFQYSRFAQGDDRSNVAPGKVFNAVPFAVFSAPSELALQVKTCMIFLGIAGIFHVQEEAQTSSAPPKRGPFETGSGRLNLP